MADHQDREHYIPLRRHDLLALLCRDPKLGAEDADSFRTFAQLVASVFHFEYHQKLEELKECYSYFNPDCTTWQVRPLSDTERAQRLGKFFEQFNWLMERANFQRLDLKLLEELTKQYSDWGLNMSVDFKLFQRLEIYARGDTLGSRYRRRWWRLWQLETVRLPVFQRLVVAAKLEPHARVPDTVNTEAIFLKIFKDIPKVDLEMLLPGARMQMPGATRLKLGSSLVSSLGLIGYTVGKQVLAAAALSVNFVWGLAVALGGYGYRQYYGYQSTKTACTLRLTQSLYYQNLDNNAGVLFHVLDEAEEQEWRETILAYYYLWRFAGPEGWTVAALDDFVENELQRLAGIKVNFEIEDSLAKLERLGLVLRSGDRYTVPPLERALEILDALWDGYFSFNNVAATTIS